MNDRIDAYEYFGGLVQDCSSSRAFAMELLQSYTKPLISPCTHDGASSADTQRRTHLAAAIMSTT